VKHIALVLAFVSLVTPNAPAHEVAGLFERVDPAVVEIVTSESAVAQGSGRQLAQASGLGSGFLITSDGLIMTAAHVVQIANAVAVRYVTGEIVSATILSSDPQADVALLKAHAVPDGALAVPLGDSDAVHVGDPVYVIGAPYGISHTLTVGHVSGRRTVNDLAWGLTSVELLQTDAAINQGNSGGPMFNAEGEVIGVVSHIISATGGFAGLGFAVTSNLARRLLLEEPSRWTGMSGFLLEGDIAKILNVPQERAILVERVAFGSPASMLGLQPGTVSVNLGGEEILLGGDIILQVQGIQIGSKDFEQRIAEAMDRLSGDDKMILQVLRAGEIVNLIKAQYLVDPRGAKKQN